MIIFEFKKLLKHKGILLLALFLLLCNAGVFGLFIQQDSVYQGKYRNYFNVMQQQKNPVAWLQEEKDKLRFYQNYNSDNKEVMESDYFEELYEQSWVEKRIQEVEQMNFSDRINKSDVIQKLETEYLSAHTYNEWKHSLIDQVKESSKVSIFQKNKSDIAIANKIASTYEILPDIILEAQPGAGIEKVLQYNITDIFIILILVLCCTQLIVREKEIGLLKYAKSMVYGGTRQFYVKVLTLSIVGLSSYFILFSSNLAIAYAAYGGWDFSAPIQSVAALSTTPYHISILQYFVLHIVCAGSCICLLGSLLIWLSYVGLPPIISGGSVMAVYAFFYLLHQNFASISAYSIFHDLNLYTFLHPIELIADLDYIAIGDLLLPKAGSLLLIPLFIGIFIFLSKDAFQKESNEKFKTPYFFSKKKGRAISLFAHEAKKIWCKDKGVLFLLLMLLSGTMFIAGLESESTADDVQYNQFVDRIGSQVSEKGDEQLQRMRMQYDEWIKKSQTETDIAQQQALSKKLYSLGAFESYEQAYRLRQQEDAVRTIPKEDQYRAFYEETTFSKLQYSIVIICIVFLVTQSYHREKISRMQTLQNCSSAKHKIHRYKITLITVSVCVVHALLYLLYSIKVCELYPSLDFQLPVNAITSFFYSGYTIPLFLYLGMILLVQGVQIWIWTILLSTWMRRWNHQAVCVVIVTVLFILPLFLPDILQQYGFAFGYHLFYPHTWLLNGAYWYYGIIVVMLGFGIFMNKKAQR